MIYKGYEIENHGYGQFVAVPEDYDGPEDGRICYSNSVEDCKEAIDEQI